MRLPWAKGRPAIPQIKTVSIQTIPDRTVMFRRIDSLLRIERMLSTPDGATTHSIQKIHIPADFKGDGYVNTAFVRDLNSPEITAHLDKKISAYRQQDLKAGRLTYNDDYKCFNAVLITLDEFKSLLGDGLDCHYCNRGTRIIPAKVRDPQMMTLDRICNTKCHTFMLMYPI